MELTHTDANVNANANVRNPGDAAAVATVTTVAAAVAVTAVDAPHVPRAHTHATHAAASVDAPRRAFLRQRLPACALAFVVLAIAFVVVPRWASDYWLNAILVPFLILSLAGLGLNFLTGYAGQLSLGAAAFMSVGAYASYNLLVRVPALPLPVALAFGGLASAAAGVLFGLPSLRIKGFYLIASTLAAQFFVVWLFARVSWFSNDDTSGVLSAPPLALGHWRIDTPASRYLFVLGVACVLFAFGARVVRSELGRRWMAVRDMDTAARVIGIPVGRTKLLAFALSSFVLGIAGALWAFAYLGTIEPDGFSLNLSFQVLFIIIIGGMGSIGGNFLGAAFIVLLPILLSNASGALAHVGIGADQLQNLQKIVFGTLIIVFLIKEPDGLARLVQVARARFSRGKTDNG